MKGEPKVKPAVPPPAAKDALDEMVFKIKADFLKQLAHPVRLEIIEYLKNGEKTVGQIMRALGVEQSNVSKHLTVLRGLGIVAARQEKSNVFYRIEDHDIYKVLRPISEVLRRQLKRSEQLLARLGVDRP